MLAVDMSVSTFCDESATLLTMSEAYRIELDREDDGRWIAEIAALPGVMVYGATRAEALAKCQALALRTLADRIEHGEPPTGQDKLELGFLAA